MAQSTRCSRGVFTSPPWPACGGLLGATSGARAPWQSASPSVAAFGGGEGAPQRAPPGALLLRRLPTSQRSLLPSWLGAGHAPGDGLRHQPTKPSMACKHAIDTSTHWGGSRWCGFPTAPSEGRYSAEPRCGASSLFLFFFWAARLVGEGRCSNLPCSRETRCETIGRHYCCFKDPLPLVRWLPASIDLSLSLSPCLTPLLLSLQVFPSAPPLVPEPPPSRRHAKSGLFLLPMSQAANTSK